MVMRNFHENEFISIDDYTINDDKENEPYKKLNINSMIDSSNNLIDQSYFTNKSIINKNNFKLQDRTPDSGYNDDLNSAYMNNNEFYLQNQSIYSLLNLCEHFNRLIKDLSNVLIDELAKRDELDYEKEIKNTFITRLLNIQVKII